MAFTAFLQLFCIASYCRFRWHEPRPVASLIFGALALPLAYALFVLKPNWLLSVPATTLPIFVGLFGKAIPPTCPAPHPISRTVPDRRRATAAGQIAFHSDGRNARRPANDAFYDPRRRDPAKHEARAGKARSIRGAPSLSRGIPSCSGPGNGNCQNAGKILSAAGIRSGLPDVSFDGISLPGEGSRDVAKEIAAFCRRSFRIRDSQRASRLRTQGLHPTRLFLLSRMTEHSFARASKWENSTNMYSRPCRSHSIRRSANRSGISLRSIDRVPSCRPRNPQVWRSFDHSGVS